MKKFYLVLATLVVTTIFYSFINNSNSTISTAGHDKVVVLNQTNFDLTIKKGVTVVDFWATWCRPCHLQAPIVEELSTELKKITFGKIEVDKNRSIAGKYGIHSIPTLIVFKDGIEQERIIGLHDKPTLKSIIQKYTK